MVHSLISVHVFQACYDLHVFSATYCFVFIVAGAGECQAALTVSNLLL